jgi:hypothetical protein
MQRQRQSGSPSHPWPRNKFWSETAKKQTRKKQTKSQTMKRLLYLIPVFIHRITGWLPFQPKPDKVSFVNIAEGSWEHGKKSYTPDATTLANANALFHYLLYKQGATAELVTLAGAGDTPLGPSEDVPEPTSTGATTGLPIAIMLLGAVQGTVRVVTDGTVVNNQFVKCAANGQVTPASNGDVVIGKSLITVDMTSAAGEVIGMIPILPGKHPF